MIKILVVCVHNSARSQMTEEYIRKLSGGKIEVESAGVEPGKLNPFVVKVLQEDGIDISGKKTNDVFELYKAGRFFDYLITVCDQANSEKCPVFPGVIEKIVWSFPDPSQFKGSDLEKLEKVRKIRDDIKSKVTEFLATIEVE